MKLNLLPKTETKGRALKTATVFAVALVIVSSVFAALMIISAQHTLSDATNEAQSHEQGAADSVATSQQADTYIAESQDVIRDANLAQAMLDHNAVYPKIYNKVNAYIPSFFRINSETATPIDGSTCTVTFTGTLQTYQQYADLVIALMRNPDAISVSRTGFVYQPEIVPPATPDDPSAMPRKQGTPPIPHDQIARIAYLQSQLKPTGYTGVGNYGNTQSSYRGATPDESLITVVVTMKGALQVPSVEQTLAAAGGAASAPAGFGGPGGPAGLGGPPPSVLGTAASGARGLAGAGSAGAAGGRKRSSADD